MMFMCKNIYLNTFFLLFISHSIAQINNDNYQILISVYTDFNGNSDSQKDTDNDGVIDSEDNCQYIFNPLQIDINNDGIGDKCIESVYIEDFSYSFLEDDLKDSFIEIKLNQTLSNNISFSNDFDEYIDINTEKITLKKNLKEIQSDHIYIKCSLEINNLILDDSIRINIIRKTDLNKITGDNQNGFSSYYYQLERSNEILNEVEMPQISPWTGAQRDFLFQDLNQDGIKDFIASTSNLYTVDNIEGLEDKIYGNYLDIPLGRFGIPMYYLIDEKFNIVTYHENLEYPDVFIYDADFTGEIDVDGDGINEIVGASEHYHTTFGDQGNDPDLGNKIRNAMASKGVYPQKEYDTISANKIQRYYKIRNGRLVDFKKNISFENSTESPFVSGFGHAVGDIDNDGDYDVIISGNSAGNIVDVWENDGNGKFSIDRKRTENFNTSSEGVYNLIDINQDGYKEYLFSEWQTWKIGYLNNSSGDLDHNNPVWLNQIPNNGLMIRNSHLVDLDGDNINELILYRTNGLGLTPSAESSIYNQILILKIVNNSLIDVTDSFINSNSTSSMWATSSWLYYEDIDGDKIKDLFVSFFTDPQWQGYPYESFRGYWDDNQEETTYFKGKQDGTFEFKYLGKFLIDQNHLTLWDNLSPYHNNNFLIHDINNDGTAELISADPMKLFGNQMVIFSFNFDDNLGTSEYIENEQLVYYPNPTSSSIRINVEFSYVKLFDLTGREIMKSTSKNIDLSQLSNSKYILRLYDDSNRVFGSSKVIKK